jgi:hypothetical protein
MIIKNKVANCKENSTELKIRVLDYGKFHKAKKLIIPLTLY